ncbi:MAG: Ig-like domain-containing protein [Bacteroidales bacterium]
MKKHHTKDLHWHIIYIAFCVMVLPGFSIQAQEVTGLDDWTLYIDQGHSQQENMGLFGYSEAEKVLRVGLALRDFFEDETDIEAVYTARETDDDYISLAGRVTDANTLATDFYYSIHSDAGPPQINSTLMLWGGWKSNGELVEKTPEGGADYGAILDWDLTGAMRIERRGNYADRVFYQGDVHHHENQWPYLYVNRHTNMASLLSEAGFHTNPGQQMLNLNEEWKVLEALSAYRSFLEWHDIDRPAIGIATGIIRDIETEKALNDATVTIGDQSYTTDGWESLFHEYSDDPEQLRNGFYFIQGLEPLDTLEVEFSKEGYQTLIVDLVIESDPNNLTEYNLSFLDVEMTSMIPPVVESVEPAEELDELIPGTPLVVNFSRKMNQESVEDAIDITPEADISFSWEDQFTLEINTSQFEYLENYTLTIDGDIAKNALTDQFLDGNEDGEEGGNFVLDVTMSDEDTDPPLLLAYVPAENAPARSSRPIIRLNYDEEINEESITGEAIILQDVTNDVPVEGVIQHKVVDDQSVLHFFPTEDLEADNSYTVEVAEGLSDMFDNETEAFSFQFYVLEQEITEQTVIDDFNSGINNWWHPQQAGQTEGIVTEQTYREYNPTVVNHSVESTGSMKLNYAWDDSYAGTPYIRLYLPPGASQNTNRFNVDDVLQVYVFGDGSGNDFRMVISDGANELETTNWKTIDWIGWKLVSWDLANDPVVAWFGGDGVLDGTNFYMDGFHIREGEDAKSTGAFYFDHLHFVKREDVNYPTELYENFQDYDDFTTNLFPWITLDVDGDITWNPQGFTFPGSGEPYAYKVMNPEETTPPITDDHPPVDGDKYLIAMMSQTPDENKWLISPQLKITELSELRFFAKSIEVAEFGPERFRVLVSMDDEETFEFNPDHFMTISEGDYVEAPAEWTEYAYFLGDYAGEVIRFAIQYVSHDDYMLMLDAIEIAPAQTYTLSLDALPEEGGSVNGAGDYAEGQQVEVDAEPVTGYHFVEWTDQDGNELGTDETYSFTMPDEDIHITGHFAKTAYSVSVNLDPEEGGSIEGEGMYFYEDEVTMEAIPANQYIFEYWSDRDGNVLSEEEVYMFSMPAFDLQLNAHFEIASSIVEAEKGNVLIYPNPADYYLYIEARESIKELTIHNTEGRQVLHEPSESKSLKLNISNLESGLYIIEIKTGNTTTQRKFLINK